MSIYRTAGEAGALAAGVHADQLIDREVILQDKMWGTMNERADATKGQMIRASIAQSILVHEKAELIARHTHADGTQETPRIEEIASKLVRDIAADVYPPDWNGFRDYGSHIANLVVAAAYLRQEIKRRLIDGEDYTRSKRPASMPYDPTVAAPKVSSDDYDPYAGLTG